MGNSTSCLTSFGITSSAMPRRPFPEAADCIRCRYYIFCTTDGNHLASCFCTAALRSSSRRIAQPSIAPVKLNIISFTSTVRYVKPSSRSMMPCSVSITSPMPTANSSIRRVVMEISSGRSRPYGMVISTFR
ncbi:putative Low-density lipoprotein receptor repeat class B [Corchorus olitorius]|uniref:Low-density lipoprotein receptor repeat class B n=1 Tax=Corchorus olitorius TaxID=93759 RepID=A0A1R3L1E7_9ROSI|nr:putative Low-density lipoprotein receptor repeat class B [Corchorus olitorius]